MIEFIWPLLPFQQGLSQISDASDSTDSTSDLTSDLTSLGASKTEVRIFPRGWESQLSNHHVWTMQWIPSRKLTYPTWGKEHHLQNGLFRGYVSSREGKHVHVLIFCFLFQLYYRIHVWTPINSINPRSCYIVTLLQLGDVNHGINYWQFSTPAQKIGWKMSKP